MVKSKFTWHGADIPAYDVLRAVNYIDTEVSEFELLEVFTCDFDRAKAPWKETFVYSFPRPDKYESYPIDQLIDAHTLSNYVSMHVRCMECIVNFLSEHGYPDAEFENFVYHPCAYGAIQCTLPPTAAEENHVAWNQFQKNIENRAYETFVNLTVQVSGCFELTPDGERFSVYFVLEVDDATIQSKTKTLKHAERFMKGINTFIKRAILHNPNQQLLPLVMVGVKTKFHTAGDSMKTED